MPEPSVIHASPDALSHLVTATSTVTPTAPLPPIEHSIRGHIHEFSPAPTLSELHSFLNELDRSVIRVKGVVILADSSCVLVQKTGSHLSITPTGLAPSGLVVLQSE